MDLEDKAQEWERSTIAESLQQLWVQMMNVSEDASASANLAQLSHLTPLDEYTRSLGIHQAVLSCICFFKIDCFASVAHQQFVSTLLMALQSRKDKRHQLNCMQANLHPLSKILLFMTTSFWCLSFAA